MLLTAYRALALSGPALCTDIDENDWELWASAEDAPALEGALLSRDHTDESGHRGYLRVADHRIPVRMLRDGDARIPFIAANRDSTRLPVGGSVEIRIASPASVLLIKRAYLYEARGWHRAISLYHALLEQVGPLNPTAAERAAFAGLRSEVTGRLDAVSDSDFTMRVSNEAFFQDFKYPWLRVHEHDDLHRVTCYGSVPMYQQMKENADLAYVPAASFERLSHDERIRLVREECYALALERVLIPAQDLGIDYAENDGFQHALRRICTTLARGWFRDFAIDNYPEISRYDKAFVGEYRRALAQGRLDRKPPPVAADERRALLRDYLRTQVARDREAGLHVTATV